MQCVRIDQDHKESGSKSGSVRNRRETRDGVHRRNGTIQSRVTAGGRFCIVFSVQYKKIVFVDLRKAKSEALTRLKKIDLSVGTPKKLKHVNAIKLFSEQFKMYCLDAGILQEKTIPETSQQNGLAERCNRTMLEMARCLLIDSGLPEMMGGAANRHVTRIRNFFVRRGKKMPSRVDARYKTKPAITKK